jgi:hypothetical protein
LHKIEEVFDQDYIPIGDTEKLLFAKKQMFAFSVLDHVLKTEFGNQLIWINQDTKDAQLIWKECVEDSKSSTKAKITQSKIHSWLASANYDNTWIVPTCNHG